MHKRIRFPLLLIASILVLTSIMCSSGYITPASLTATAAAPLTPETVVPTAFLVLPTSTETPLPSATATPDDSLFSPTPELPSATPQDAQATLTVQPVSLDPNDPPQIYYAQSGDALLSVALRFNVNPFEIVSPEDIPPAGLIPPGQMLMIPQRLGATSSDVRLVPDSDVVFSPSAIDFDANTYVSTLGGYLSTYREYLASSGWLSGAQVVQLVATQNSVNPRILLSLLEYQSHWVLGQPNTLSQGDYPLGYIDFRRDGLFQQLTWATNQLSIGYYGWRSGELTEITFKDGSTLRLAPDLNAGTVAIYYFFAQLYNREQWELAVDPDLGLPALHNLMFGDSWARAAQFEPLLPANLEQPEMVLPFMIGQRWAYTSGPHGAWENFGAMAALDFAPGSVEHGCAKSDLWAVASAPGIVARSGNGVVVLDMDGDGNEQTGWVMVYLHVTTDTSPVGRWLDKGDLIGHPSCEGGRATGTHLHIARKYNGEWILAAGAVPFNLSGWEAGDADGEYKGILTKDGVVVYSCTCGNFASTVVREAEDASP